MLVPLCGHHLFIQTQTFTLCRCREILAPPEGVSLLSLNGGFRRLRKTAFDLKERAPRTGYGKVWIRPEAVTAHLEKLGRSERDKPEVATEVGIGSADHRMMAAELILIPLTSADYGLTMTLMSEPEMLLMYE
jgi:hypothetical protein